MHLAFALNDVSSEWRPCVLPALVSVHQKSRKIIRSYGSWKLRWTTGRWCRTSRRWVDFSAPIAPAKRWTPNAKRWTLNV